MYIEELIEEYRNNDYYNLSKTENITKLCEEIERLNKIINNANEYIKENIAWRYQNKFIEELINILNN